MIKKNIISVWKKKWVFVPFFFFTMCGFSQIQFSEIASTSGLDHMYWSRYKMGGGMAVFDLNKDGFEDLYFTGGKYADAIYMNSGNGTFYNYTNQIGEMPDSSIETLGAIAGDMDNDGHEDIFITTDVGFHNILLHNNGDGTFSNITITAGLHLDSVGSYSTALGDYDKDGYLDIYVVNYVQSGDVIVDSLGNELGFDNTCFPNFLYHNNGDLTFSEVSVSFMVQDSGCGLAACFTDFDEDNDPDLFLVNDFGEWNLPNTMFQNNFNSGGGFEDVGQTIGLDQAIYGMGITVADYDNDMDLDYYVTNIGSNLLMQNNASFFTDVAISAGVDNTWDDSLLTTGWGTEFTDVDNDGFKDLVVANGHISMTSLLPNSWTDPDKLYHNNGNSTFLDISSTAIFGDTLISRSLVTLDFDRDGDQDILIMPIHWDTSVFQGPLLFMNESVNTNNWINLKLQGVISNASAVGALVSFYAGNIQYISELMGSSGFLSSSSKILHFGMGNNTVVDSLIIKWPLGIEEKYYNLVAGNDYSAVENNGISVIQAIRKKKIFQIFPNPVSNWLEFKGDMSKYVSCSIFSVSGRIVMNEIQEYPINVSGLKPGLYIVEVFFENQKSHQRFLKL